MIPLRSRKTSLRARWRDPTGSRLRNGHVAMAAPGPPPPAVASPAPPMPCDVRACRRPVCRLEAGASHVPRRPKHALWPNRHDAYHAGEVRAMSAISAVVESKNQHRARPPCPSALCNRAVAEAPPPHPAAEPEESSNASSCLRARTPLPVFVGGVAAKGGRTR